MQDFARIDADGQITIPKEVRDALCLNEGDAVLFTVCGGEATIKRIPRFTELAGIVDVPEDKKNVAWKEIRAETWRKRAARYR